jgi:hypothetical protein
MAASASCTEPPGSEALCRDLPAEHLPDVVGELTGKADVAATADGVPGRRCVHRGDEGGRPAVLAQPRGGLEREQPAERPAAEHDVAARLFPHPGGVLLGQDADVGTRAIGPGHVERVDGAAARQRVDQGPVAQRAAAHGMKQEQLGEGVVAFGERQQ